VARRLKVLVLVEIVVCFGPAVVYCLLGVLFIPVLFVLPQAHFGQAMNFTPVAHAIGLATGGTMGLIGVTNIIVWLVKPTGMFLAPKTTLVFLLLGIVAALAFAIFAMTTIEAMVGILPILATGHLVALARGYLFRTAVSPTQNE
jgi:hypothetical protein